MSDEELRECAKEHNIEASIFDKRRHEDRKKIIEQLCTRDNYRIANISRIYMIISILCVAATLLLTLFNISKLIFK